MVIWRDEPYARPYMWVCAELVWVYVSKPSWFLCTNVLYSSCDGDLYHNTVCGRQVIAYCEIDIPCIDLLTKISHNSVHVVHDGPSEKVTPTGFTDLEPDLDVGGIDITWELLYCEVPGLAWNPEVNQKVL